MKKARTCVAVVAVMGIFCQGHIYAAGQKQTLLEKIGVTRGICVVLGDPECKAALELARIASY